MTNDRQITITVGENRKSVNWRPRVLMLSEFYESLRLPARSTETVAQYLSMTKGQQSDLKDVGGFLAGSLNGTRRKPGAVTGRDLLTLDLDSVPPYGTENVLQRVGGLGCGYCVYSTRKHRPTAPRLRVLLPLDRTATADEYEPCARKLAELLGMELADPTTFQVARMMYYPSVCSDGEYIFVADDKPFLSVDGVLAMYADWHDYASWPAIPGTTVPTRLDAKQKDPLTKDNIVGDFCRCFNIRQAMDEFLPGVYLPVDSDPDRFTYRDGSTAGGAVLYEDDKFLFSHHATDPCSEKLVNAFDMVRLHCFGELDDEAAPGTPVIRLPSYEAMQKKAAALPAVQKMRARARQAEIQAAFSPSAGSTPGAGVPAAAEPDSDWMTQLKTHAKTGAVLPTIDNARIILEHDPNLSKQFALNSFSGRGEVLGPLPWDPAREQRPWSDNDNFGIYWYMEKFYQLTGNTKIDGALSLHSSSHAFNPVVNYLEGLQWDGVPRLDTLLIDYLGAADNPLTRAITRQAFVASVARAMRPGTKYDDMLIIGGAQGIGKSTLIRKMSKGWFTDGLTTFEGKEPSELIQGVWLVEIGELDAFRKSDIKRIKQFISQQTDRFRAAYGRHVQEMPRCCVFFGTTNDSSYLQDRTGNRRFLPVDAGLQPPTKSVFDDLDSAVDQIWAEAVALWRVGFPLVIPSELKLELQERQEGHRDISSWEGPIVAFVEKQVPEGWAKLSVDARKAFWGGGLRSDIKLVDRDRICALEVWVEVLGGGLKDLRQADTREINGILEAIPGWEKAKSGVRFGEVYGSQRGFVKKR